MKRHYIKRYCGFSRNPKVRALGRGPDGLRVVWMLEELWSVAAEFERDGVLRSEDLDSEILAAANVWWGFTPEEVTSILDTLTDAGFLLRRDDGCAEVNGWSERYSAAGTDSAGDRECGFCREPFTPAIKRQKWCSAKCRKAAFDERERSGGTQERSSDGTLKKGRKELSTPVASADASEPAAAGGVPFGDAETALAHWGERLGVQALRASGTRKARARDWHDHGRTAADIHALGAKALRTATDPAAMFAGWILNPPTAADVLLDDVDAAKHNELRTKHRRAAAEKEV